MVGTKLAPPAGSGAKLTTRLLAALMALMLCAGLVPAVPAWADEGAGDGTEMATAHTEGTVTLSIVKGVGYDAVYQKVAFPVANASFSFEKGATVDDLFSAAVDADLIKAYEFGSTWDGETYYLSSVTANDGTVIGGPEGAWMSGVDGDNRTAVSRDMVLEPGKAYQLAWCANVSDIQPSAEQWAALGEAADKVGSTEGDASVVTLSLVKGVGYDESWNTVAFPVANAKITFSEGATVDALFSAAVDADLIKAYEFGSTWDGETYYLSSVTANDGTVIGGPEGAWMSGVDGDNRTAVSRDMVLEPGKAYQLAWCANVSDIQPSAEQWAALGKKADQEQETVRGEKDIAPGGVSVKVDASELSSDMQGVYSSLFANLAAGCVGAGGAVAGNNTGDWNAITIAATGQAAVANKDAVITSALASYEKPDGYNLQRSILALSALGIDATKVPAANGSTVDLVAKLADDASAIDAYPTSPAYTLLAYASGPYEVSAFAANSARNMIDQLALSQDENGAWVAQWGSDTTAMVIPALAAYGNDSVANRMLTLAIQAMRSMQQSDGGYGNVNATAVAVIALCAAGIDPDGDAWATAEGGTPLKSLLTCAKDDLSGFVVPQGYSQAIADQQGFAGLVAYQGLKNTGAAYNIYTQAAKGQAGLSITSTESVDEMADEPAAVLAQTGDDVAPAAGVISVALLSALACALVARRKVEALAQDMVLR